jgi:hypothetical protein
MASSFLTREDADPVVATRHRARLLLSDLEARAQVDSLERLHHRRRVLLRRLGKLKALYGPFGLADSYRKQMRAVIATEIRALLPKGQRLTKDELDDRAMADPRYIALLDTQVDGSIEYSRLQNRVTEIEELIRNRDLAIQAYNKELWLRGGERGHHGP